MVAAKAGLHLGLGCLETLEIASAGHFLLLEDVLHIRHCFEAQFQINLPSGCSSLFFNAFWYDFRPIN